MSVETQQDTQTATPAPSEEQPASAATPPSGRRKLNWAGGVALIALIAAGWQWWDSRQQMAQLQRELARRLSDDEAAVKQIQSISVQAEAAMRDAHGKIATLENKVTEFQNQQAALEGLYQDLSRNRDEWSLAEVEQIVAIANHQLQLAGNAKAALLALEAADSRLQGIEKPELTGLRKILNQDIERLKRLPVVDAVGISVRLDNMSASVDSLPLLSDSLPSSTEDSAPPRAQSLPADFLTTLGHNAWEQIKQLVRIENIEQKQAPLLSPSQAFFLREQLKLRLLSARLALAAHDETTYKADLHTAEDALKSYFDTQAKTTRSMLATLRELYESPITIALPDISGSLDAVHNFRLAREKPTR